MITTPRRSERRRRARCGRFVLAVVGGLAWCLTAVATPVYDDLCPLDFGCIFSRNRTVEQSRRFRAAGPFYEQQEDAEGRTFNALHPLFSTVRDPVKGGSRTDILWPVGTVRDLGADRHWRFIPAFGDDFDTADPESRYRRILFPFLFMGRDRHGEDYFAVFPLGGKVHEFLMRDRMAFVLFPLYGYGVINDVETRTVLWPIVSWTRGGDVSRFRAFPFYGQSVKGEEWEKRFVLWPLWTSSRYNGPEVEGSGFVLFPLFGRVALTDQKTWMLFPPLFRWSRTEDRREVNCPWPFVQYASGDVDKLYLWPLWGRKVVPRKRSSFFLWPIGWASRATRADGVTSRFMLSPLFYHEKRVVQEAGMAAAADAAVDAVAAAVESEATVGGGTDETRARVVAGVAAGEPLARTGVVSRVESRHVNLWPLCSYERQGDLRRFRTLSLWPGKVPAGVERNWSALWTLYSRTRSGSETEHDGLWGLVRHRRSGEKTWSFSAFPFVSLGGDATGEGGYGWSVLKGLVGYRREGLRKTFRLLYFLKVGMGQPPSGSGDTEQESQE